MSKFVITKNIAKHGNNSIIVIPKVLREELQPKTLVKLTIEVIRKPEIANEFILEEANEA